MRFMQHLYVEGLSPSEIYTAHPDLEMLRDGFGLSDDTHQFGRHVRFFRELSEINLAESWASVDARVLAIHGEYDWVSGEQDHEIIVEVVHSRRPGTAQYITMGHMDHGFLTYATLDESYVNRRSGQFDPAIIETCVKWMRDVIDGSGGD